MCFLIVLLKFINCIRSDWLGVIRANVHYTLHEILFSWFRSAVHVLFTIKDTNTYYVQVSSIVCVTDLTFVLMFVSATDSCQYYISIIHIFYFLFEISWIKWCQWRCGIADSLNKVIYYNNSYNYTYCDCSDIQLLSTIKYTSKMAETPSGSKKVKWFNIIT